MARRDIRIGTAGWAISSRHAERFRGAGTQLRRYSLVFNCAEVASSFYRPHMRKTYERWAASTPSSFRFSVKLPKLITHDQRLREPEAALDRFAEETRGLGDKFGAVLVELPPSLVFDAATAGRFFAALAQRVFVPAVCEPRHRSWFTQEADAWFAERRIGRAATDPVAAPGALDPGGWPGIAYFRLHGSPRMYYSAYEPPFMSALVRRLEAQSVPTWCIFDNAAEGAALGDALAVLEQVRAPADA